MQRIKKLTAIILSILVVSSVCVFGSVSAGASGTGAGLAEWALNAYYSGWSYVYGGSTPGAVDCSGLIYSYCGGERVNMIETCTEQGSVSAGVPNIHGLGLWRPGHVGVYLTGGKVAEARGFDYGTVITDLDSRPWTDWFQEDGIQYEERKADKCMIENYVLRKGMNGPETKEAVKSLQILLNGRGYRDKDGIPLSVDGSFGSKTDFAVKRFQLDNYPACGEADGVVGTLTWTKLING